MRRDVFLGDKIISGRVVSHEETYTIDAYKSECVTSQQLDKSGYDFVGILVILDNGESWFSGYEMKQENVEDKTDTNATAWYVSSGIIAGINYIKENNNKGIK